MVSVLENLFERVKHARSIVIVGAGYRGQDLLSHFQEHSIPIQAFFDNYKAGSIIMGVKVMHPYKIETEKCVYIITVDKLEFHNQLSLQLQSLGINEEDIITYDYYEYISNLDEKYYADELQKRFLARFGKKIDWENPVTYNEKINCDKLYVRDKIRTTLADKYLVRDWIREQIGEKYLNELYGVWDDADEIDFEHLPKSFVLKVNNGSGRNIIVTDKSKIEEGHIKEQLREWMNNNFAYASLELQYKDIVPKIICEAYLEGVAESVYDYNIYCFHGEPEYIWCIKGSHRPECKASFYDKNWNMMPFSYGYPRDNDMAPRPEKLEEMLSLSRVLSKNFKHVRVDWYNLPDGRVLFGEMTFTTWSGMQKFEPEEYDVVFGKLI